MSVPANILSKVYHHYRAEDWCVISLNDENKIIYANSKARQHFQLPEQQIDIKAALPLLATETLETFIALKKKIQCSAIIIPVIKNFVSPLASTLKDLFFMIK